MKLIIEVHTRTPVDCELSETHLHFTNVGRWSLGLTPAGDNVLVYIEAVDAVRFLPKKSHAFELFMGTYTILCKDCNTVYADGRIPLVVSEAPFDDLCVNGNVALRYESSTKPVTTLTLKNRAALTLVNNIESVVASAFNNSRLTIVNHIKSLVLESFERGTLVNLKSAIINDEQSRFQVRINQFNGRIQLPEDKQALRRRFHEGRNRYLAQLQLSSFDLTPVPTERHRFVRDNIVVPLNYERRRPLSTDDEPSCLTCADWAIDCRLEPCGHDVMCCECAEKWRTTPGSDFTCPICRVHIMSVSRLTEPPSASSSTTEPPLIDTLCGIASPSRAPPSASPSRGLTAKRDTRAELTNSRSKRSRCT